MNDDMRDEVPVPHYEDELWLTLARVHAERRGDAPGASSLPGVEGRLHRRGRRLFFAGVGSIAAAAVALAAIVATDAGEPPAGTGAADPTPTPTDAPELSLAAQITAATEEASATSLIHKVTDNLYHADDGTPIGDSEMWTDEQSGAMRSLSYDSEGEPSFDSGPVVAPAVDDPGPPPMPPDANPMDPTDPARPQQRIRDVDYCFAEYAESDRPAIPGHIEADRLGEWLEQGRLVEDGTEVMDGRELIRLVQVPVELVPRGEDEDGEALRPRWTDPADPSATTTPPVTDPDTGTLDPDSFEYVEHIYLVDAETHRPVHVIGYPGEAADYSDAHYIATIEYLERTPENMALLAPPVPEGFEQVADLRGDGERYDRCGW